MLAHFYLLDSAFLLMILACADAVLNGIAWNDKEKVLYLTGKLWPRLYKIKLLADVTDDDDEKKKGKKED
jgi:Glutamine cyclotransferase